MSQVFFLIASINGFLAVALGAFAAHALKNILDVQLLATFQTGVQYHMTHTLALLVVALLTLQFPQNTLLKVSGWLFILGIVFFSGSLYALSLSGIRWLGAITPIGGVLFLGGWGCLFWLALKTKFQA
jgi:uncharacterized membrane protein YgdD (TMEM256/DUF423 family)